jgi:perosamine synthetase
MRMKDPGRPAIEGGKPIRETSLPYGRQWIDEEDIRAVVDVLTSSWLTTGPKVGEFEERFATTVGTKEAVAVSSGTAALHAAVHVLGLGRGDEVIVPAMTFAATANCVAYEGGIPVFSDVEKDTLLLDPAAAERLITPRTRAIIAVDYTGHPCEYRSLSESAEAYGLALLDDACHALGGSYRGRPVGSLANLNTFSFHPVKHITSGEGGMITTDDPDLAARMRVFRNHGITTDQMQRERQGSWFYEMVELGYNYRLTDFQCALGMNQLTKLPAWIERRREIARIYDEAFQAMDSIMHLAVAPHVTHAYHLYVVRLDTGKLRWDRSRIFQALRAEGIGVNVHYIPVHLHPYYRTNFGTGPGLCPVAEAAYQEILSLPIFPRMKDGDVQDVIQAVGKVLKAAS